MLGPLGSDLMSILRILTPDEIDRYADSKDSHGVVKVAVGGEDMSFGHKQPPLSKEKKKFSNEHQAEIIPIDKLKTDKGDGERPESEEGPQEQPQHKKEKRSAVPSASSSALESIGVLSSARMKEIDAQEAAESSKKKDSTTAFLLKERDKMRESKRKLVEKQAYKLYKQTSDQDLFEDDVDFGELDEELSVGLKGILINKKHF